MYDLDAELRGLALGDAVDWAALDGSSVLVTGATGLIGSNCVRLLLTRNRVAGAGIRVHALVRNLDKARAMLGEYGPDDGLAFLVGDVADPGLSLPADLDYIVHAGCPTASSYFAAHPVETALAIVDGTANMLELARRTPGFRSLAYVSSMEAYGAGNHSREGAPLTEADLGYTDTMAWRSCYPEGKRMAENLCCDYAAEYGVHASVVRLAQTFGPGIAPDDGRVFAQFARAAIDGTDIVLRTTGASSRMYLYTFDAVCAILAVLTGGAAGTAYNAANPATFSSVYEMAQMVADEVAGGRIKVRVEVDPDAPYPPEHHLPLDVSRLEALGWRPTADLRCMYERLIACIS